MNSSLGRQLHCRALFVGTKVVLRWNDSCTVVPRSLEWQLHCRTPVHQFHPAVQLLDELFVGTTVALSCPVRWDEGCSSLERQLHCRAPFVRVAVALSNPR